MQQERIDEGIASVRLSRAEAKILQSNSNGIKSEEVKPKADGKVPPKERARLSRQLSINSGMIYKKKHKPVRRLCP